MAYRGRAGVKLETILISSKHYTSREALQRFVERTTAAADGEPTPSRTSRQRERDIRGSKEFNKKHGLLPG